MAEHDGDCPSIKTSIEIVENSTGHWHSELKLVHGGEIKCQNRHNVPSLDSKSDEGGGNLEAAAVGLCPCEGGIIVLDGNAIAINGGSSLEEGERSKCN